MTKESGGMIKAIEEVAVDGEWAFQALAFVIDTQLAGKLWSMRETQHQCQSN